MRTVAIVSSDTKSANNSRFVLAAYKDHKIPDTRFIAVSDNKAAAIFDVADQLDIPHYYVYDEKPSSGEALRGLLLMHNVDLVALIGYKPKINQLMLDTFPGRIINLHPAPIPAFGGKGLGGINAQVAVLKSGSEYTGPTIHIVDQEYDHGQTLAHWPIRVRRSDTPDSLNERCNVAGRKLYIQVINDFIYRLDHPQEF